MHVITAGMTTALGQRLDTSQSLCEAEQKALDPRLQGCSKPNHGMQATACSLRCARRPLLARLRKSEKGTHVARVTDRPTKATESCQGVVAGRSRGTRGFYLAMTFILIAI